MKESKLEAHLRKKVEELGGMCIKMSPTYCRSIPDRLCLMPSGFSFFVELKTEIGKLSEGQEEKIRRLRELGHMVFIVRSVENVHFMLDIIAETLNED